MKAAPFPDIDGAQDWYQVAKDGIRRQYAGLYGDGQRSNHRALDLFGERATAGVTAYRQQAARHEVFATLALLAACEGGIRRDLAWRTAGGFGQRHHERFRRLVKQAGQRHVPLSNILAVWNRAERHAQCAGQLFWLNCS